MATINPTQTPDGVDFGQFGSGKVEEYTAADKIRRWKEECHKLGGEIVAFAMLKAYGAVMNNIHTTAMSMDTAGHTNRTYQNMERRDQRDFLNDIESKMRYILTGLNFIEGQGTRQVNFFEVRNKMGLLMHVVETAEKFGITVEGTGLSYPKDEE